VSEEYITNAELLMLVTFGMLLPFIGSTAFQLRLYRKISLSKIRIFLAIIITFILTAVLGVVLWSFVPILTLPWQILVFKIPGNVGNVLALIPLVPMSSSAIIITA
jgi:hypothetical protein